jgi:hypothetical protein
MTTVTSTVLVAALAAATAEPKIPSAKLLDLYAVKEGESYVVHVLANGDISQFSSDRKTGNGSYRLTLDIPALSPLESKHDVSTPFSRRFQVWPMQLGKQIYSRIEIELEDGASSVVGLFDASHLYVRIQRESPLPSPSATAVATGPRAPEAPETDAEEDGDAPAPVEPEELAPTEAAAEASVPPVTTDVPAEPVDRDDEELFFSLFPTPAREQQTLFNVTAEETLDSEEAPLGLRVGRFAVLPSVDFTWIRGGNLLLSSEAPFVANAYLIRGRLGATLLDSEHELELAYEGRYRNFQDFTLEKRFTQFADLRSLLKVTPSTSVSIVNHFVYGAFESQEFDPGGEVVASTDPFYRNFTRAVVGFELSERFGAEVTGAYNLVDFLEPGTDFFDYQTRRLAGTFLYDLTPLTSLLGEYNRVTIPEPLERPEAGSTADVFLFGLRGELTPYLRGQARAGYAFQRMNSASVPQDFRGFVADVSLTRDFGEASALTAELGRRTNPSAFEQNGYYVSSYGRVQFITPFARNFRLTATGVLYANDYPVADPSGVLRDDQILSGAVGVAYFFAPLSFVSCDFRHDRRNSNLDAFAYRNNALQLMVGFGFLNR